LPAATAPPEQQPHPQQQQQQWAHPNFVQGNGNAGMPPGMNLPAKPQRAGAVDKLKNALNPNSCTQSPPCKHMGTSTNGTASMTTSPVSPGSSGSGVAVGSDATVWPTRIFHGCKT
jgi:hypothetical protein